VWEAVVAVFEWFKGFFTTLFETWSLAFQGDWRGFGEKIRETWDEAWNKIKEIGQKAWQAIQDFFQNTDWGSIGLSILEGIAKGITAGYGFLRDAARGAAQAALDAAKGFLGIHSPARVPGEEIGEPIPEGIAQGIMAKIPDLRRSVAAMGAALMSYGDQMITGPQSMVLATDTGGGLGAVTVQVHVDRVGDDMDLEMLARRITRVIQRRG